MVSHFGCTKLRLDRLGCPSSLLFVPICLTPELVISSDTLRTIMTELYKALDTPWTTDIHKSCATFVAEIVLMLYRGDLTLSPWLRCNPPAEGLVLLLFQGSCLHNGVYDEMRTDITHAWQAAVVALARTHGPLGEPFLELLGRFSSVLAGELLGSLDVAGVDHIAKMTASLLRVGATDSMGATDTTTLARIYDVMMSNVFQNVPSWTHITELCLYADNLRGHHYITQTYASRAVENKSVTSATSNPVDSLYKYYTVALFTITVLMELCHENLDNSADDDDESETDDEITEDCNHLVSSQSWPLLQSHLLNILYANVIAHTFTAHFKSAPVGLVCGGKEGRWERKRMLAVGWLTYANDSPQGLKGKLELVVGSCFGGLCQSSGCIPSRGTADDEDQPMVRVEGYKEGVSATRGSRWAVGSSPGKLREHGLWAVQAVGRVGEAVGTIAEERYKAD
uniref:Uncharacterized protein n=1 Tax=Timema cristinae TaxID=61476 RepID=A0A7R9H0T6_TIMCR|nr:unnamed protein product [Timema cristinae]